MRQAGKPPEVTVAADAKAWDPASESSTQALGAAIESRAGIESSAPALRAPARASLELVVAVAENDVIGAANRLPWRLPADLRRFKAITLGKTLLMGRKTYESIGHALPGRVNLVLTRSATFEPTDCRLVHTLDQAIQAAGDGPLMVIGGAEIYRHCLALAVRIHLTLVHARVDGDTFFADWRQPEWLETCRQRHEADRDNAFAYSFVTLERQRAGA